MSNRREIAWGVERRPRERKSASADKQLSFAERRSWGGPRKGAGRKAAKRANVLHVRRPAHVWSHPVHVTLRRAKGLPSLRSESVHGELREVVRSTRRGDFRIVHFSIQSDHVHMIVEAESARALANGMKSFTIRGARRLNSRVLRRRGAVWGDRYHRRDLTVPSDVRNVLVYVLDNHLKHHEWDAGLIDPCSSAAWFAGWMHAPAPPSEPPPTEPPRTWLLERGWLGRGAFPRFLHRGELPRALRGSAR